MIFRKELAELILDGKKTATRRTMSDNPRSPWWEGGCKYEVGQTFAVQNGRGKVGIATATVTAVYTQAPLYINWGQALEEGFRSPNDFRDAYRAINGKNADLQEHVWVIEFRIDLKAIRERRKLLKRFTTWRASRSWGDRIAPESIDKLEDYVRMGFLTKETFKMHDRVSYQLTKAGQHEAAKVEAGW